MKPIAALTESLYTLTRIHTICSECLIQWEGCVSRCGKVFGRWERLGQKSFRSWTEPLMGQCRGVSFSPKWRSLLQFYWRQHWGSGARELPANRLEYHFMHAYSEGWKEARPFLQPLWKDSFNICVWLNHFWNHPVIQIKCFVIR